MTGISGWHLNDPARRESAAITHRMAASLPLPDDPKSITGTRGALACRLDSRSMASDSESRLHVAIEGAPKWLSSRISKIANADGDGVALLAAYQSLGRGLLAKLSGPFALAIVDERTSSTLLAVDRMGIRPMCYSTVPGRGLIFGSTANSIIASAQTDNRLSSQSIYNYMYFHVVPSPSTIHSEIQKLEPGQFAQFSSTSVHKDFYFTPQFATRSDATSDQLKTDLMKSMRAAVARSAPGDGRTGAFLSGGLDSSTVCGLASELVGGSFPAYSIGFGQEGYDEIEYARLAASHFGLKLREYYVTPDDVAEAIPVIAANYDEPFGNSSAVPAYFCARIAKEDGIDCLLAGDGGDELFAGNERYATQQLFEYYHYVPGFIRELILEPAFLKLPTNWSKLTRKIRRYIEQARVPMPERMQTYNYLQINSPQSIFEPDFIQNIDIRGPAEDMASWYERGANFDFVDRMLMFDWKLTLADNDIRKVNRMCAVAGVDVHYPLLDEQLVEFSTSIPATLKLPNRKLRHFFKSAVDGFLPRDIIEKQKHGFGLPFGEWLLSSNRLRDVVFPAMKNVSDRGIFQKNFIDELLKNHENVHAGFYGNIIWVLVMLEYWLQFHEGGSNQTNN